MNAQVTILAGALVALSLLHAAAAYRYGDVVPMEKRGQFNFVRAAAVPCARDV